MPVQNSIKRAVQQLIVNDLSGYPLAIDTYERALEGELTVDGDISYAELFLQNYAPADAEIAGYLIGQIHAMVRTGAASAVRIHVGSAPALDRHAKENTVALENLPPPFHVDMAFGKSDSDGQLYWDEAHPAQPFPGSPLTQVPIEVGHTDVETLYWHLCQCGGFARWPFDCEWIVAFGKLDPIPRFSGG